MKCFPFIIAFFFAMNSWAQEVPASDYSRMPDKVYLHLDRDLYAPGDTIWMKAYVFHRNNQELSDNDFSLHIQMLSQDGREVGHYKLLVVDGMGVGQIPIITDVTPGYYQLIAHTGHMKNFGEQFFFKKTIEITHSNSKVSIRTFFDKDYYAVGDTAKISFKAFDEYQLPYPNLRFQYALTSNDKKIEKRWLKCYEDGSISVNVPISQGSKDNPPKLDLYYFEHESDEEPMETQLFVPMKDDDVVVHFFPEGGNIIKGMNCKIAFEATDLLGEPVEVKGVLLENGEETQQLSTMHDGMGLFLLYPNDAKYSFKVTEPAGIDKVFELPKVIPSGYNIAFLRQDAKSVYMTVTHNFSESKKVSLWVSQNDALLKVFDFDVSGNRMFALPKADFPCGVVTFTITDDKNRPQAERLVYLPDAESNMAVSTSESIYSQRKKVVVTLKKEHPESKAFLSAAVVDSVMAKSPNLEMDNIKSYTYLSSELKGKIHDVTQYLENDRMTEQYRDLLLMTHGWRRFAWIYKQQYQDSLNVVDFKIVSGQVVKGNKPEPMAKITAMAIGDFYSATTLTANEEGKFSMRMQFEDRKKDQIQFQGKTAKGRDNVQVILQNTDTLLFGGIVKKNKDNLQPLVYAMNRYVTQQEEKENEKPFLSYETKMLKELVVYGDRNTTTATDAIYEAAKSVATASIKGEDLLGDFQFSEYVMQAAPHKISYDQTTDFLQVASRGVQTGLVDLRDPSEAGAYIYLNRIPYSKYTRDLDFLSKEDIIEIVVLDPDQAFTMYGTEGAYGIILVRTKPMDFTPKKKLSSNMAVFDNFIKSREYYKPIYETKSQDSAVVVDNRITLDWEPLIETDENGKATFEFYTDDISGTKQIIVQGIDEDGNLYYQTKTFESKIVNLY